MNDSGQHHLIAAVTATQKTLEQLVIEENARLRSALGQIKDRVQSCLDANADLRAIWTLADDALRRVPAPQPGT